MKLIPIFLPENSCPHRCAFCDVRIANGARASIGSPEEIPSEINAALATLSVHHPEDEVEIAFYGGTFTAGDSATMRRYLRHCEPFLRENSVSGIRVSTRPDRVDEKIALLLKEHGVTTIELGVESFDNAVLRRLNRGHSAETAVRAIKLLKSNDFVTGIHLMAGCPGESKESFQFTVSETLKVKPDTVRIHPLLVLAGTGLAKNGYHAPGCDKILNRLAMAAYCLEAAGIPVIRMGLQPTDSLSQPGQILSGCFHPALRHRVFSRIYRRLFQTITPETGSLVAVSEKHLSYAVGFKRENAALLREVSFKGDPVLQPWDVLVNGTCYHMLTEGLYEIDKGIER